MPHSSTRSGDLQHHSYLLPATVMFAGIVGPNSFGRLPLRFQARIARRRIDIIFLLGLFHVWKRFPKKTEDCAVFA